MTAKIYQFPARNCATAQESDEPTPTNLVRIHPPQPVKMGWRWHPKKRRWRSHTTEYEIYLSPTSETEDAILHDPQGQILSLGNVKDLMKEAMELVQAAKRRHKRAFPRA